MPIGRRFKAQGKKLQQTLIGVRDAVVWDKCKWLDPQIEQRLKAREASKRPCTLAKASEAELDCEKQYAPVMRTALKTALRDMPCDVDARRFFDSQAALPQ